MGWGRTLLLGDLGNRLDIGDVESDIQLLRQRLHQNLDEDREQGEQIDRLRADNEDLKLVVSTLVRLLTRKGVIDGDEIRAVAGELD